MKNLTQIILLTIILLSVNGCGSNEKSPPPGGVVDETDKTPPDTGGTTPPPGNGGTTPVVYFTGNSLDGEIYYNNHCADCHRSTAAGDNSSIFGSRDLSVLLTTNRIKADMHAVVLLTDYNLMGNFTKVPPQRVADLRIFLNNLSDPVEKPAP